MSILDAVKAVKKEKNVEKGFSDEPKKGQCIAELEKAEIIKGTKGDYDYEFVTTKYVVTRVIETKGGTIPMNWHFDKTYSLVGDYADDAVQRLVNDMFTIGIDVDTAGETEEEVKTNMLLSIKAGAGKAAKLRTYGNKNGKQTVIVLTAEEEAEEEVQEEASDL